MQSYTSWLLTFFRTANSIYLWQGTCIITNAFLNIKTIISRLIYNVKNKSLLCGTSNHLQYQQTVGRIQDFSQLIQDAASPMETWILPRHADLDVIWIRHPNSILFAGVVIPLIFPKVPQSSQTESLRFPRNTPSPWVLPPLKKEPGSQSLPMIAMFKFDQFWCISLWWFSRAMSLYQILKLTNATTKGQLEELISAKRFCHLRLLHNSQTMPNLKFQWTLPSPLRLTYKKNKKPWLSWPLPAGKFHSNPNTVVSGCFLA